jgi:hypothetical protein
VSWLEEKDDWEGDYGSIIKSHPLGIRFTFDYTSKTGKKSSRTVRVREFGETGFGVMLIGYCEARQAIRTFMAERIANCSIAESGEAVPNITEYLDREYRKSTDFTLDTLFSRYVEAFKLLVYFFRADGKILAPERAQLLRFCLDVSRDDRLNDDGIKRLIEWVPLLSNHTVIPPESKGLHK